MAGWMSILVVLLMLWIDISMAFISKEKFAFTNPLLPAGYVRTKAYVRETPEFGIGIHKVPVMVPVPTLIFRKRKYLFTRPSMLPLCLGCERGQVSVTNGNFYHRPMISMPNPYGSYGSYGPHASYGSYGPYGSGASNFDDYKR